MRELSANARKEWLGETRSLHGLMASGVFGLACAVTLNLATLNQRIEPVTIAAIIVILLIFSSLLSVPRAFIAEDEGRTFDLLSLVSKPEPAFYGKCLVHVVLQAVGAFSVTTLFCVVCQVSVQRPLELGGVLILTTVCLVGNLGTAAALVVGAQNKWVLAALIALPLVVPTVFMAHPLILYGLGVGDPTFVWRYAVGLLGLGAAVWAVAPLLVAQAWNQSGGSA